MNDDAVYRTASATPGLLKKSKFPMMFNMFVNMFWIAEGFGYMRVLFKFWLVNIFVGYLAFSLNSMLCGGQGIVIRFLLNPFLKYPQCNFCNQLHTQI